MGGLYVLIELFAPVSGGHFNPVVSLVLSVRGALNWRWFAPFVFAQLVGAALGAALAHAMFDLPLLEQPTKVRAGLGQWIAEAVATGGLILIVLRAPPGRAAGLIAAYIGAEYWFTASTSFANPAAAFGRMLTNTFAEIAPGNVIGFVIAELAGAGRH